MCSLNLFLFGVPRVEYCGEHVRVDRRKAMALLAYLGVSKTVQSRETLTALLWPELETKRAFAYLRNAIWVLKQTPLAEYLEVRGREIALHAEDPVCVDVNRFAQFVARCGHHDHLQQELCPDCLSLLRRARDLYKADFLTGFTLPDSPAFDDWQLTTSEELRRDLAWALERLVGHYNAVRDFGNAIRCAQRWVGLDPLYEVPHRSLMNAYMHAGQAARAVKQYQECAEILRAELGTDPSNETRQLLEQIRRGALGSPADRRQKPAHWSVPSPPTPFVGRERELTEVSELLSDPGCRLLSIVGVGGSGKTRLAIEVAARLAERYEHGACFVALAPVTTPEFVALATLDALPQPLVRKDATATQIEGEDAVSPETILLRYLRDKRMLMVFDNMEHLTNAAELLVHILEESPGLTILVTSRQRLHLKHEWAYDLAGLRYPGEEIVLDAMAEYGAVQLFLQCARRVDAGFQCSDKNSVAIVEICRLLEGIPLGIELAASWVKTLPCGDIASEIAVNLDFLTTQVRDIPDRHRSLRAVFDQSWRQLPPEGRICFRKLAVFRGGFTRRAAKEVAGAALPALASLVDKSMLRRPFGDRYELLEVLRQFAEERLLAVPRECDLVRDRHARHYLDDLKRAEPDLKGSGLKEALRRLRDELGNIRTAWRWASRRGMAQELHDASTSLFLFYDIGSRYEEGAEMFREARESLGDPASDERMETVGFLAAAQAWFVRFSSPRDCKTLLRCSLDYLELHRHKPFAALPTMMAAFAGLELPSLHMKELLQDCLEILQNAGDRWGEAMALEGLAYGICKTDLLTGLQLAQRSLEIRLELGDNWGKALSLFVLGRIAEMGGDYQTARRRFAESREVREELEVDPEGTLECIDGVGRVARYLGDYTGAREMYQEGLAMAEEMANRYRSGCFASSLSLVAYLEGEFDEALRLGQQCVAIYEELGMTDAIAHCLAVLGFCHLKMGDRNKALSCFERSLLTRPDVPLTLIGLGDVHLIESEREHALGCYGKALIRAREKSDIPLALWALAGLARALLEAGVLELSAELVGFAMAHRGLSQHVRMQLEESLPIIKNGLTMAAFEAARRRGRGFDFDTVIREVEAVQGKEK